MTVAQGVDPLIDDRLNESTTAPNGPTGHRTRRRVIKAGLITGGLLVGVGILGWAGLQVEPDPFSAPAIEPATLQMMPLPEQLPLPVDRFYRTLYGDEIPVIEGAVISGRGTMRVSGVTLPVRFRFTHDTGNDYRHQIEITFFGRHIMTVDESFIDGTGRLELPFGVSTGPNIDQGANLALWAEAIWMPALWITDPRVRWEAIDDSTALLIVPFEGGEEHITVFFDPETGLVSRLESMRFKGEGDENKTLWINEVVRWDTIDGWLLPVETTVQWADEGSPWARLDTDSVLYAADVSDYFPAEVSEPPATPNQ